MKSNKSSKFTDKVKKDNLFKGHKVSITTSIKEKMSEVLFDFAEPVFHVPKKDFNESVSIAEMSSFKVIDKPHIRMSHAIIFNKKESYEKNL